MLSGEDGVSNYKSVRDHAIHASCSYALTKAPTSSLDEIGYRTDFRPTTSGLPAKEYRYEGSGQQTYGEKLLEIDACKNGKPIRA